MLVFAAGLRAESAKNYQVTGPIVALTENVITVQKGDERWEIARSANTKTDGKLAVGNRVTVYYKMSTDSIEVKDAGANATDKTDKAAQKVRDKTDKKTTR